MTKRVVRSGGFLQTEHGESITAAALTGNVGSTDLSVTNLSVLLKAAYTATSPKSATTLYFTSDTGGIFYGSTTIVAGS